MHEEAIFVNLGIVSVGGPKDMPSRQTRSESMMSALRYLAHVLMTTHLAEGKLVLKPMLTFKNKSCTVISVDLYYAERFHL